MWSFLAGLLELFGSVPPGRRVTVEDRYAMKRRVRELRRREQEKQAEADANEREKK